MLRPQRDTCLFEPIRDGYLLWAGFHALFAFETLVGALFLSQSGRSLVTELRPPKVIINYGIVVYLEDNRDFHTVRTGHAVFTAGARDGP